MIVTVENLKLLYVEQMEIDLLIFLVLNCEYSSTELHLKLQLDQALDNNSSSEFYMLTC